jgi:hypothetical protein
MDHQNNADTAYVARTRALLAATAIGAERLESAAHLAFCRLAALREKLARLEWQSKASEAGGGKAARLNASTLCHEARVLLRYVSSRQWPAGRFVANGCRRGRLPAGTCSDTVSASP